MRSRSRALLLLLLLGTLLLEALVWLRTPLRSALHRAYPEIGLDPKGEVFHYDVERRDHRLHAVEILAADRRILETLAGQPDKLLAERLAFTASRGPAFRHRDFDKPRFLELKPYPGAAGSSTPSPLEILVAGRLNFFEGVRRGMGSRVQSNRIVLLGGKPPHLPVRWAVENDRLVCRETATGKVVAGFGPDGYTRGEGGGEGAPFGPLATGPIQVTQRSGDTLRFLLLPEAEKRVIRLSIAGEQLREGDTPFDSPEPLALEVEVRPLQPIEAGASESREMPYAALRNGRLLLFRADGSVIAEIRMEPGETIASIQGARYVDDRGWFEEAYSTSGHGPGPAHAVIVLQTLPAATHPADERVRLRLFRAGEPPVTHDVHLEPARPSERFFANLAASLALLRPAPLALASALAPLPENVSELRWWREPWLSGGRYWSWLLASLALAAACGWRARRTARERCRSMRDMHAWTAAVLLLGPLGLFWMRLVLPRVPVAAVGGARRAVDLDASPSSAAPWPAPQPLGIEVIA